MISLISHQQRNCQYYGAVKNESNFIWKKGLKAKNYIKNSGGKLFNEAGKSYVVLPNGKTKKIGFLKNPSVFPNSVIVTDFRPEGQGFKESITQFIDNLSGTITFITTTSYEYFNCYKIIINMKGNQANRNKNINQDSIDIIHIIKNIWKERKLITKNNIMFFYNWIYCCFVKSYFIYLRNYLCTSGK